ncbi:unnamed protein product [Pedinophyceae sp. YPF-701]|nr:unnamed protein product [Pedinophyceae sp. YPF-701]
MAPQKRRYEPLHEQRELAEVSRRFRATLEERKRTGERGECEGVRDSAVPYSSPVLERPFPWEIPDPAQARLAAELAAQRSILREAEPLHRRSRAKPDKPQATAPTPEAAGPPGVKEDDDAVAVCVRELQRRLAATKVTDASDVSDSDDGDASSDGGDAFADPAGRGTNHGLPTADDLAHLSDEDLQDYAERAGAAGARCLELLAAALSASRRILGDAADAPAATARSLLRPARPDAGQVSAHAAGGGRATAGDRAAHAAVGRHLRACGAELSAGGFEDEAWSDKYQTVTSQGVDQILARGGGAWPPNDALAEVAAFFGAPHKDDLERHVRRGRVDHAVEAYGRLQAARARLLSTL